MQRVALFFSKCNSHSNTTKQTLRYTFHDKQTRRYEVHSKQQNNESKWKWKWNGRRSEEDELKTNSWLNKWNSKVIIVIMRQKPNFRRIHFLFLSLHDFGLFYVKNQYAFGLGWLISVKHVQPNCFHHRTTDVHIKNQNNIVRSGTWTLYKS